MDITSTINILTVIVLISLLVASVYLILVLHRANKMMSRIDSATESLHGFIAQVVPAIVNVGTIAAAVESVVKTVAEEFRDHRAKTLKERK